MNYTKSLNELNLMQQNYAMLFSVINKIQIRGDEYFNDLTSRQFMTLVAILHLPQDETTINNIAHKLGTSKQNVNRLITSIESKGYLVIVPSEKDKRAVNVKLTEAGELAMTRSGEKAVYLMANLFNRFSMEELEMLWTLLNKLYSFDGEILDGFEEHTHAGTFDVDNEYQTKILETFIEIREAEK